MAIEKVKDILVEADKNKTAVIAFDAFDYNTIIAAIQGAEAVHKPVILMLYPTMNKFISLHSFAETVKDLAKGVRVPIGLHLDHSSDYDFIMTAIREGFTSVMADGSSLPFEGNVKFTSSVVHTAKIFGADVEGELGKVGRASNTADYDNDDMYTSAAEAAQFAEETGVTSLAIAIGSAHGVYKVTPKLDIKRLQEIDAATSVPLVLHGGSGIPEDQLVEAFRYGINKFNVGTEFFMLNTELTRKYYQEQTAPVDNFSQLAYIRENLQNYIERKLTLTRMSCN